MFEINLTQQISVQSIILIFMFQIIAILSQKDKVYHSKNDAIEKIARGISVYEQGKQAGIWEESKDIFDVTPSNDVIDQADRLIDLYQKGKDAGIWKESNDVVDQAGRLIDIYQKGKDAGIWKDESNDAESEGRKIIALYEQGKKAGIWKESNFLGYNRVKEHNDFLENKARKNSMDDETIDQVDKIEKIISLYKKGKEVGAWKSVSSDSDKASQLLEIYQKAKDAGLFKDSSDVIDQATKLLEIYQEARKAGVWQ